MAVDWCPFALKRPVPNNHFTQGRAGQKVRAVVLHVAAGPLSAVYPTFSDPNGDTSAHFCVGKDGTIEQYVSVNDTAHGNGLTWDAAHNQWLNARDKLVNPTWQDLIPTINPNLYTVSIEHTGYPADAWTSEMYDANNRLLFWLAEQFDLVYVPHRTLVGHCKIDPLDKGDCPGPHVEYDRMAADIAAITAALKFTWMPINTDAALYKFAQANNLGYPQTDEFEFVFGSKTHIGQVFNLGIAYVAQDDLTQIRWMKKPKGM